ncbi:hypothetical protein XAB3213_2060018 [Xanthomonas citri pv. bilvae]|nr:hypothetical protein XAB3213_2060018 [Xanthomonas citri pv. bilvae]
MCSGHGWVYARAVPKRRRFSAGCAVGHVEWGCCGRVGQGRQLGAGVSGSGGAGHGSALKSVAGCAPDQGRTRAWRQTGALWPCLA